MRAYSYEVTECATGWPVSLDTVKRHLNKDVDIQTDDDYYTSLINAATLFVEKYTKRDLITKTYKTFRDTFPGNAGNNIYGGYGNLGSPKDFGLCLKQDGFELRRSKLQSVESFQYLKDDVLTSVPSSTFYTTDETDFSSILLVDGESWPTDEDVRFQVIEITFKAGFGEDEDDVPEDIRIALLHIITNLFEERGDCTTDNCSACLMDGAAKNILDKWRIVDIRV